MGAVGAQVLQPLQVSLQLPTGQLHLQQQRQVAEDKGVQGGRAAAGRRRDGVAGQPVGPGRWGLGRRGRQGRRGHTALAWCMGLPRWRQPALNGTLSQGCIKGTLSALQAPPVPAPPYHTQPHCHQGQRLP